MTLNGVMAVILRYFSEFGYFSGALRKKFTFAISSPDEFLIVIYCRSAAWPVRCQAYGYLPSRNASPHLTGTSLYQFLRHSTGVKI